MPFFLILIVLPIALLCLLYFYRLYKEGKAKKNESPQQCTTVPDSARDSTSSPIQSVKENPQPIFDLEKPSSPIIKSYTLLDFAELFGKMQIVSRDNQAQRIHEHYCRFTDQTGRIIKVNFSKSTEMLTSDSISKNKDNLCVNIYQDGSLILDFKSE